MYNGIVLDKVQRNAFLSMAAYEGLICEKGMTDGVYDKITHCLPLYDRAQMLLEQFTVSGSVYVDPFIYKCLDGELIEKEFIMPYKKCEYDVKGFFTFDIDTVQLMLAEKNIHYTNNEIREIFAQWQEKVKEFLEFENKYNLDYNEVNIRSSLPLEYKTAYEDIDIDYFLELGNSIYHDSIFKVLEEYRDIFNVAYHNDLLSPVINTTSSFNNGTKVPVMEGIEAVKILKYTSERLDRIYTPALLRDCVRMAQTEEAKEYRKKMDEWLSALYEQDYDNIQMIEHEISKVQNAMKFKEIARKAVERTGMLFATIGVASTALTQQIEGMGMISSIATYAGFPIAFYNPIVKPIENHINKKYLWASFGTYHQ